MTYAATPYLPTMTSAWRPRPPSWRDMQMWGQTGRSRHRPHDTRWPEPCRLDHTQPNAVQPPAFLSAVIKRKAGLSSRTSGRIADQRTECSSCPVHELLHEDRRDVRRLLAQQERLRKSHFVTKSAASGQFSVTVTTCAWRATGTMFGPAVPP